MRVSYLISQRGVDARMQILLAHTSVLARGSKVHASTKKQRRDFSFLVMMRVRRMKMILYEVGELLSNSYDIQLQNIFFF